MFSEFFLFVGMASHAEPDVCLIQPFKTTGSIRPGLITQTIRLDLALLLQAFHQFPKVQSHSKKKKIQKINEFGRTLSPA
jgi:hypothetical protein